MIFTPVDFTDRVVNSSPPLFTISEPNDESGANVDAAIMWRENREEFNKIANRIVRKTLGLPS